MCTYKVFVVQLNKGRECRLFSENWQFVYWLKEAGHCNTSEFMGFAVGPAPDI